MFLLRLATPHSLSTSSWKRPAAMGTLSARWLLRCCATASRKNVHVRNSASSVVLSLSSAEVLASCSSHESGRPSSESGVGGRPAASDAMAGGSDGYLRTIRCAS